MNYELLRIIVGLVASIGLMVLLNRYLNVHAFFGLLVASIILAVIIGKPLLETLAAMQTGFGVLLQQIGFIVALGSCLGIVMEKTGAMEVVSQQIFRLFGTRRSVLAMTILGALVGIPVFCDSGYIILSRLIPSFAAQSSIPPAQLSLALSTGLYSTHTLVPPTPGPLAAAANLGLGNHLAGVIGIGLLGAIPVATVSYILSKKIGRAIALALPVSNVQTTRDISPIIAFLPLVLPIVLISIAAIPRALSAEGFMVDIINLIGHPILALVIGLSCSFVLISTSQKNLWPAWISEALKDAGVILLITGAGGAFGNVIKSSGIDAILKTGISGSHAYGIIFLIVAFVIAAVLKTAQGSTTSSMIITSSLLAPLAAAAGFASTAKLSILLVAIGGGAMTVSHANDSYFWVISQFTGFSARDTFKSFTLITLFQGITALFTSIILYLLW